LLSLLVPSVDAFPGAYKIDISLYKIG